MSRHAHPEQLTKAEPIDLSIEGMSCASCVSRVEKALKKVPGVESASVNLATERARVEGAPASTEALQAAVRAIGYDAHVIDHSQPMHDHAHMHDEDAKLLLRDTIIAAVLTAPIFIVEMGGHLVPAFHHWTMMTLGPWNGYLQFILATIILAWPGRRFFVSGIPALLHGAPEMNALVALGSGAAWLYSTVATFLPSVLPEGTASLYFEATASGGARQGPYRRGDQQADQPRAEDRAGRAPWRRGRHPDRRGSGRRPHHRPPRRAHSR